jgi:galactokinase
MSGTRFEETFQKRFGAPPETLASAPGRINLIGEHTDYNLGLVMPASIDLAALTAVGVNDVGRFRFYAADLNEYHESAGQSFTQADQQWANYLLGVLDQLHRSGQQIPPLDCAFTCDIPAGAGLSSSAAITCAFVLALNHRFVLGLSGWEMVDIAQAAENEFVGAQTGMLDQFASIFGLDRSALLLDCRSREYQPQPINLPNFQLVLLHTGVTHNHTHSGYDVRRQECEQVVKTLQAAGWRGTSLRDLDLKALDKFRELLGPTLFKRASHVLHENARVIRVSRQLAAADVIGFGESLTASHWSLSRDFDVSCPESDAVVGFATAHSACAGARQMGGGFGGCILCVVHSDRVYDFIDEAQQDYFNRFAITLRHLPVSFGPGARVILTA